MSVPGLQMRHEKTQSGAALVITTTGDVAEVRRLAREMDAVVEPLDRCTCCPEPLLLQPPHVAYIDGGVRLTYLPVDHEQLNHLVADYAARLRRLPTDR